MSWVLISLMGGFGAAARFAVDGWVREKWANVLPVATLVVNVTGSLLIGLLAGGALYHGWGGDWLVALTVGFCGGYTTFSTAMVETVRLAQAGQTRRAVAVVVGSLLLTVGAAALGTFVMYVSG
jgi:fluoride exporter